MFWGECKLIKLSKKLYGFALFSLQLPWDSCTSTIIYAVDILHYIEFPDCISNQHVKSLVAMKSHGYVTPSSNCEKNYEF